MPETATRVQEVLRRKGVVDGREEGTCCLPRLGAVACERGSTAALVATGLKLRDLPRQLQQVCVSKEEKKTQGPRAGAHADERADVR